MKNPLILAVTTLLLAVSRVSGVTIYVSPGSFNPTPPYTNWATAARNIQDAVNAAQAADVVVVTNGTYPGVVGVYIPITLLSVNGPKFTIIDGGGAVRCCYLVPGSPPPPNLTWQFNAGARTMRLKLATVTLTNTSQLYFDTSAVGQPERLWRIVPVP